MQHILGRLKLSGLKVMLDGDHLKCGPRHLLTGNIRAVIRANKAEIIRTLRERLNACPLWQAGLICHVHAEGRCNYDPSACNVANGMRNYIDRYLLQDSIKGRN